MEGEEDPVARYFPWHVVELSRRNPELQRYHGVNKEYLVEARSCPKCETPPERLRWVYVRDDAQLSETTGALQHRETPQSSQRPGAHECREGYLLICDRCPLQVDFFCERKG